MSVLGGDISVWQDSNSTPQKVDLHKAYENGWRFVLIKASQATWADEDYVYNWGEAKAAKLLRGAYHFMVWETDPVKQAEFFWKTIQADPGEIPPTIDFEWWKETPANALTVLRKFADRIEKLSGRKPMIYTGPYFWKQFGSIDPYWQSFPLWIANYEVQTPTVPAPWGKQTFWQYTSKGNGPMFGTESLNVDLDLFNGSYEDLQRFCGIEPGPSLEDKINLLWQDYLKRNGQAS